MTAPRIVGREDELGLVVELIDQPRPNLAAVLLEGEPGLGKTTLWRAGLDRARSRDLLVLVARPAASEGGLPYAALGDLLEPLLDGGDGRAGPHAILRTAVGGHEGAPTVDRLAVSRSALALLRDAADAGGLMLAIDDLQWLDPASAGVIEFALRRLAETPIRVLLTRRGGDERGGRGDDGGAAGAEVVAALGRDLVRRSLGPLDPDELDEVLRSGAGVARGIL